jgi:hypothetical protein
LRESSDERPTDFGEPEHGRVHFPRIPSEVITREREGKYLQDGRLELANHSVWERTFDERGQPLEWRFFEDSVLTSISEYRYEGDECIVTERDASGKVIEVTKQKPFSVTMHGSEQRIPLPDSWPVSESGLVASFKNEFDFDSTGNWIKHTTTTTVSSARVVHVDEREITYW